MSHWTRVKLKITDEETLVKALARMGYEATVGQKKITQYGRSDTADIVVDSGVGFKKEADGTYSMIGDFYHSRKMRKYYNKNKKFTEDLNAAYGIEDAMAKVESLGMGFELTGNEECEVDETGMIRLEFTTYQAI